MKVLRISFVTKEEFKSFLPQMMPKFWSEQSATHARACEVVSVVSDSFYDSMDCGPPGFLYPGDSAGKNTGGCKHCLLTGYTEFGNPELCLQPPSMDILTQAGG